MLIESTVKIWNLYLLKEEMYIKHANDINIFKVQTSVIILTYTMYLVCVKNKFLQIYLYVLYSFSISLD